MKATQYTAMAFLATLFGAAHADEADGSQKVISRGAERLRSLQ